MILTAEQEMIRDSIRAFAQERLAPFAADWDRNHTFPAEALKELAALGALGMVVPEEWGGAGMDYMSLVLALEEIAAGDGATSTIVSVQNSLPCGILNRFGTDAQKEAWLKLLARGEKACAAPGELAFAAGLIRSSYLAAIPDEDLRWPGGPGALLEEGRLDLLRAVAAGRKGAAEVLESLEAARR